jgi:hypothetical protein
MLLDDDESVVARRLLDEIQYAAAKHPMIYHAMQEGLLYHIDSACGVDNGDF